VTGYTLKDQTGNTGIRYEFNIINLNSKIVNSRIHWMYHVEKWNLLKFLDKLQIIHLKEEESLDA
jgi:hypothetical protein